MAPTLRPSTPPHAHVCPGAHVRRGPEGFSVAVSTSGSQDQSLLVASQGTWLCSPQLAGGSGACVDLPTLAGSHPSAVTPLLMAWPSRCLCWPLGAGLRLPEPPAQPGTPCPPPPKAGAVLWPGAAPGTPLEASMRDSLPPLCWSTLCGAGRRGLRRHTGQLCGALSLKKAGGGSRPGWGSRNLMSSTEGFQQPGFLTAPETGG